MFYVQGIVIVCVQFLMFVKWMYRRMRNEEIAQVFVRDMATNHLPHIQGCLNKIAKKVGVELPDDPPIQFVDLNGNSGKGL